MAAKDRHKDKLLNYLGNPSNEFPTREFMALRVLGIAIATFYKHFTPDDLSEIEKQALQIRRKKYAPDLAKTDRALLKNASDNGGASECKLVYQRFDGWSEKQIKEHTGKDGEPLVTVLRVEYE